MIGYTCVGTNDFPRARAFYDALFASIGATRLMEWGDAGAGWGRSMDEPLFGVTTPFNKQPATVGNGVMIAIACRTREEVDQLHAKALELGGTDEGAPGLRGGSFYAGYFRDLDGNKINGFVYLSA